MIHSPLPPFNQRPTMEPSSTRKYHRCPAPGCQLVVPNRMFSCAAHWRALSHDIRRDIMLCYRPSQTVATASEDWKLAVGRAIEMWKV